MLVPLFSPRSAYLHIPFCHRRCFYCDFAVVPLGDRAGGATGQVGSASIVAYLGLLQREIASSASGPPLATVYLGGGTPSLLTPGQVGELLDALQQRFGIDAGAEITLELDPASFDQQRLIGYLEAGINRVSLGGQSFDDAVLQSLGRRHSGADLAQAIDWMAWALSSGHLASWSLDLIQAVPTLAGTTTGGEIGGEIEAWRNQLQRAIASGAPHLSVYELTLEPGTVFGKQHERGLLSLPSDDLAADLMELTAGELRGAGYGHYEISSYAKPGHASRHNRVYWSGAGWWGFGMGATAAPWGHREARPRTRQGYGAWLEQPAPDPSGPGMPFDERLLVGLRRREGVRMATLLEQVAGLAPEAATAAANELAQRLEPFRQRGLLRIVGQRWQLSDPEGLALSNAVLREMLSWWDRARAAQPPTASGPPSPET